MIYEYHLCKLLSELLFRSQACSPREGSITPCYIVSLSSQKVHQETMEMQTHTQLSAVSEKHYNFKGVPTLIPRKKWTQGVLV